MKYLLFVILLGAVLITTGCINQNEAVVKPIQTTAEPVRINTVTTISETATTSSRTYCNDTRSILAVIGALPGTRYSGFTYSDTTIKAEKDELLTSYKNMFSSFEEVRASSNKINILMLKDFPDVSKYQSCNWMVHCIDWESGTKCYEIPTKYRVTFTDNGIPKHQDFPISQPINFDFDDNDLLKMINIQASNNTVSTTALPTQSPPIKPTSFITTYPSPVHTYDPCTDQYDPTCGPDQVRYYGTCMYGVKIVCRPVY